MNTIMSDEPSKRSTIDIIDLDEEPYERSTIDIIDLDLEENSDLNQKGRYDEILLKNQLLGEFIDKCLELENTKGMHRVLNKSLIPLFEKCRKEFQESENLRTIISRAICNLEVSPHFKFSHIAKLCQSIKINRHLDNKHSVFCTAPKKTQKKNFNRRMIRKIMKEEQVLCKKPEKITEVVLSDDSDCFEVPIVNIDESKDIFITITANDADRSIQLNDKMEIVCNNQRVADKTNNNKENTADYTIGNKDFTVEENVPTCFAQRHAGKENTSVNNKAGTKKNIATKNSSNNNVEEEVNVVDLSNDELVNGQLNSSNAQRNDIHKPLLVPLKDQDEVPTEVRIQAIKTQIGLLHTHVVKLEKEEMLEDSVGSSFILCERYKVKILELYSLLCSLVNAEPVKRREVHFTAVDERLRLPLKNLEEFINANIGSDGVPYFPDFNDVVECVKAANISADLGLNKQKILADARTLFTYCGRALQKSRQRREWRQLLRYAPRGPLCDPADADAALRDKLEANRRHARTRETELIDRYSEVAPPHVAESEVVNDTDKENIADVEREDVLLTPAPKKKRSIAPISCDKFGMVPRDGFKIVNTLNHKSDDSGQNKNKNFEVDKTIHHTEVDTPENQLSTFDRDHSSHVDQIETIASHEDTVPDDSTNQCYTVQSDSMIKNEKDCRETTSFPDNNILTEGGKVTQIYDTEITDDITPEIKKKRMTKVNIEKEPIHSHNANLVIITDKNGNVKVLDSANPAEIPGLSNSFNSKHINVDNTNLNTLLVPSDISNCDFNTDLKEPIIKEEPCIDIQPQLYELGDNFTTTVIDIQDPFLVVEISSDSSDDEIDSFY